MVGHPKFTKRAAQQIARLEAEYREHVPPGNYLSFIGSDVDVDPDLSPEPTFRLYYSFSDSEGVPEEMQVECHGVRLAYAIHVRLLAGLQSSALDFDGDQFLFVDASTAQDNYV